MTGSGSRTLRWIAVAALALTGNVLAQMLLMAVKRSLGAEAHFWPFAWSRSDWLLCFSPLGALLLATLALLWEAALIGYQSSSLKRIVAPSSSSKTDLFYLFLYISGFKTIFGVLFTLGIGQFFYFWLIEHASTHLLTGCPFALSLAVLLIVNSFLFYWIHRVAHMRLFWPMHQVHHSATEVVMITNFRNHPITILIEAVFYAFPAALLGASTSATLAYAALNGIYQLWAHSKLDWKWHEKGLGFLQDWVLLAPEDHRLHHSRESKHWGCNYGSVPLWDKLFGTWTDSRTVAQPYSLGLAELGSEDDQRQLASVPGLFKIWIPSRRTAVKVPASA